MSDAAERLAQALRDLIHEAAQEVITRELSTPPSARAVGRPTGPEKDSEWCPSCRRKGLRHLIAVTEARQQLGGISRSTFYALVKAGDLPLVKIGSRSFVQAEALDAFVRRKAIAP
jgi:excisionase family DNA binding protein